MTTIDLLLSAWVIIALPFPSSFICFMMYSCLLCFGVWLLLVLIILVFLWPYGGMCSVFLGRVVLWTFLFQLLGWLGMTLEVSQDCIVDHS
jgi:hypothetical protein